jgi:hypothetical protein
MRNYVRQPSRFTMPEATRRKIGEAAREQRKGQPAQPIWGPVRVARIRAAYESGGVPAAIAAFPEMTVPAVRAALRRYCVGELVPNGVPAPPTARPWKDPDFRRRFMEALTNRTQSGIV